MSGGNIADIYGGGVEGREDEGAGDFECLPAGWYPVSIDREELKDTTAGTGKYLKLMLTVLGENHANRKLFTNINLLNPSEKCQEIGQRQLGALTLACGIQLLEKSEQLLGKNIDVRIKIKKGNAGYGDDNDVTEYAKLGSKTSGATTAPARTAQAGPSPSPKPAPSAAPAKRPWE